MHRLLPWKVSVLCYSLFWYLQVSQKRLASQKPSYHTLIHRCKQQQFTREGVLSNFYQVATFFSLPKYLLTLVSLSETVTSATRGNFLPLSILKRQCKLGDCDLPPVLHQNWDVIMVNPTHSSLSSSDSPHNILAFTDLDS